jgi:hypothetical protein
MSVHLECDRCGFQEQTGSVMLFAGLTGPGIPTARPELPVGWTRPRLPTEDDELRDQELCPGCKADLFAFMRGVAVPGRTVPVEVCQGCGHHAGEGCGCPPNRICPGCGHLRHADPCPDHVSEVGPCGCKELTTRKQMKELGIYD